MTSRLLPRVSVYTVNVILYPRTRPRTVAEHDAIVQGELLFWLQRVLLNMNEQLAQA
jgi:hypothetical protein